MLGSGREMGDDATKPFGRLAPTCFGVPFGSPGRQTCNFGPREVILPSRESMLDVTVRFLDGPASGGGDDSERTVERLDALSDRLSLLRGLSPLEELLVSFIEIRIVHKSRKVGRKKKKK